MKRILVTGGAGFIGSHLCERLLKEGDEVICMDNYFTGDKRNILPLLTNKVFELSRNDVVYPYSIECDEIYNLACPASPVHYQRFPTQTISTCVIGTVNALKLARRLKIKILQASTSEVYGDPTVHPQTEQYWGHVNPIGIRSCYDEGKRCAETICMDYYRQYGVKVKIARIFNTYGPHMAENDGRVERLQDISERGAIKEGVELQLPSHLWKNYRPKTEPKEGFSSPFSSYETLWRQINGGESWNSNPWVWVIEFERANRVI